MGWDIPGQSGTGTKKSLSRCPFVAGQEQQKKSRDKLLCPGTSRDKITFYYPKKKSNFCFCGSIFRKKSDLFHVVNTNM